MANVKVFADRQATHSMATIYRCWEGGGIKRQNTGNQHILLFKHCIHKHSADQMVLKAWDKSEKRQAKFHRLSIHVFYNFSKVVFSFRSV